MPTPDAPRAPRDPRPSLTPALDALIAQLVTLDDLRGLRAHDILVVALGAHGTVAASVRSLDGATVTVARKRRRIELGLRPPFFLDGDAPRRLTTLLHELLHLDPRKPGALLEERRHAQRAHAKHEEHARVLAKQWLDHHDPLPLLCLAHHGEVLMRTWRNRPVDDAARKTFTDRDVFEAPLLMHTPQGARGSWW
jgi:hypothetical protein